MNKISFKKIIVLSLSLFLMVLLTSFKLNAFYTKTSKSNNLKRQMNFPIQSLVPNLTIIESAIQGDDVHLTVRNDSSKTITAYSISSGNVTYRIDQLGTPDVISPGSTFSTGVGISAPNINGVFILAAVYEDGTADGKQKFVKQILDYRAGKQSQLQRIHPILQDSLATTKGSTLQSKLQTYVLKLQSLPEQEDGASFEYNAALHDEKELALIHAKQVEQIEQEHGEDNARRLIIHLKEECEREKKLWDSFARKQR